MLINCLRGILIFKNTNFIQRYITAFFINNTCYNFQYKYFKELSRVEEEITTLRTVLQSKIRHAGELKRKLGITVWKEISDDMNQGIKNVKESTV